MYYGIGNLKNIIEQKKIKQVTMVLGAQSSTCISV